MLNCTTGRALGPLGASTSRRCADHAHVRAGERPDEVRRRADCVRRSGGATNAHVGLRVQACLALGEEADEGGGGQGTAPPMLMRGVAARAAMREAYGRARTR